MKRKYQIRAGKKTVEREYNYIPVRYVAAFCCLPDQIEHLLFE